MVLSWVSRTAGTRSTASSSTRRASRRSTAPPCSRTFSISRRPGTGRSARAPSPEEPPMDAFKPYIAKAATGAPLTREEARSAFDTMLSGEVTPAQAGAFLMALRVRGETVDEIAGAVTALRNKMLKVEAPAEAMDVVGTGGDNLGSYNISTLTALIVAAAGVPVAKHGNRAASSNSGAADVLTALGVKIGLDAAAVSRAIKEAGVGFMFAQTHHASMRHVGPVRVELGTRTLFNLIGPLSNPAGVKRQLLGVFSQSWLEPLVEVLAALGSE